MSRGSSAGEVVTYRIPTLQARNGSIPPEMASDLSIRALHGYSDDRFLTTLLYDQIASEGSLSSNRFSRYSGHRVAFHLLLL